MRPILAPVLLHALRLLLLVAACSWGPAVAELVWSNSDELVHLYTAKSRNSFYLQIHPNGHVDRTVDQTIYSALIIKTVDIGLVRIMGAKSRHNLCMDSNGKLFESSSFSSDNCVFKHTLLENGYGVYESPQHHLLVSLGRVKGELAPDKDLPPFSQFLTRRNEVPESQFNPPQPQPGGTRAHDDLADLCGGILAGRIPEEMPLVDGIHPCFIEGEEERDPNGATLSRRFPEPSKKAKFLF